MNESNKSACINQNKRDFVKKAAYVAPMIVTMAAVPSFASAGSGWQQPDRQHRDGRTRPLKIST